MPKSKIDPLLEQIDLYLLSEYHRGQARKRRREKERRDRMKRQWLSDLPYLLASTIMVSLIVLMIMTWR